MSTGIIPEGLEILRRSGAKWVGGQLRYTVWISKSTNGMLAPVVYVGDAKFGVATEGLGGMSIRVVGALEQVPWPDSIDDSFAEDLRRCLGDAISFVVDRADLCELFQSREDVHRGTSYAELQLANYPARLVQSLIIARDLGRADLEASVRIKLQEGPIQFKAAPTVDIYASAKRWAREFERALDISIPI